MVTAIVLIVIVGLVVIVGLGVVFMVGMRRKSPLVLDAVRRFSRRVTNPRVVRTAGDAGAGASLIRHVGRTTGRHYETPVGAHAVPGGFVVALPYGTRADWLKNVLASGAATIVDEGTTYSVEQPALVATSDVAPHLPAKERRTLRMFKVDQCLRVEHAAG